MSASLKLRQRDQEFSEKPKQKTHMKKSRFCETKIISILKQVVSGLKVEDVCRQHGISSASNCNRKSKYGGMEASDLNRMKQLKAENARLKRMCADLRLENDAIKEFSNKSSSPDIARLHASSLVY